MWPAYLFHGLKLVGPTHLTALLAVTPRQVLEAYLTIKTHNFNIIFFKLFSIYITFMCMIILSSVHNSCQLGNFCWFTVIVTFTYQCNIYC